LKSRCISPIAKATIKRRTPLALYVSERDGVRNTAHEDQDCRLGLMLDEILKA
jgi:hypothetical protein